MYIGLKHLHSYLAFLVLAGVAFAFLLHLINWLQRKPYKPGLRAAALIGMVLCHVQFLFGLFLYFVSPLGMSNMSGDTMKNAVSRLYALEHPLIGLIAIVLITIGNGRAKRSSVDSVKYRSVVFLYGIGLLLILSRVPWQVWPAF